MLTFTVYLLYSHNLVLVGYVTGSLAVWDIPTQKLRHVCKPEIEEGRDVSTHYNTHIYKFAYCCFSLTNALSLS